MPSDDPESNRRVLDDTVVLHNARAEDSAVYQCEASNSHGSILANMNIMVMSECYSRTVREDSYNQFVQSDVVFTVIEG